MKRGTEKNPREERQSDGEAREREGERERGRERRGAVYYKPRNKVQ